MLKYSPNLKNCLRARWVLGVNSDTKFNMNYSGKLSSADNHALAYLQLAQYNIDKKTLYCHRIERR